VRSAAAEGCILCAERLLADGQASAAAAVYDDVRGADLPEQRILEATRGSIVSRGADGIPLLVEQIRSSEKSRFEIALMTARELPLGAVIDAFSGEVLTAPPERAAIIVTTIGDCAVDGLPPAVLEAAGRGDKQVRLSAIAVVGRLGDISSLTSLLEVAQNEDAELSEAAINALVELPGADVDAEIVRRIRTAPGSSLPTLLALVGERRLAAAADLIKALEHEDVTVRGAALRALGATVAAQDLPVLIAQVVSAKTEQDRAAAEQALSEASIRMPDRDAAATQLAAAMDQAAVESQASLLRVLGAVGGPTALRSIGDVVNGGDPQLQDVGTRVLGEWMTADAAPVLLEIRKNPATSQFHVRALRGYLRIARQLDMRPRERVAMCQQALEFADRPEERRLVLDALRRSPSREALDMSIAFLEEAELREEAIETTLQIAERLRRRDRESAKLAGEKVLQASPATEHAERARALTGP
jgi:HEAT repeat protein